MLNLATQLSRFIPTERTGLFEGDLRCLSRLGCLTSALMKPFLRIWAFSSFETLQTLWPALMLGIFSGEFAKRQQMMLFAVF
jgi:hypothetical protein